MNFQASCKKSTVGEQTWSHWNNKRWSTDVPYRCWYQETTYTGFHRRLQIARRRGTLSDLSVNGGCSCKIHLIECSTDDCNWFPLSQLIDVYRLVEDQIDMPSVAVEVLQGKLMKYWHPAYLSLWYWMAFSMVEVWWIYLCLHADLPSVARDFMLSWSDSILSDRQY